MEPFESLSQLALPPQVESRLQELMRLGSEGKLSLTERPELDLLMEARESLAALRAKGKGLLRQPPSAGPVQTTRNGVAVLLVPPGTPPIDPALVRRYLQEEGF